MYANHQPIGWFASVSNRSSRNRRQNQKYFCWYVRSMSDSMNKSVYLLMNGNDVSDSCVLHRRFEILGEENENQISTTTSIYRLVVSSFVMLCCKWCVFHLLLSTNFLFSLQKNFIANFGM